MRDKDDFWDYDECPVSSALLEEDQRFVFEYYSRRSLRDAWKEAFDDKPFSRHWANRILARREAKAYALAILQWRTRLAVPDPARVVQGLEELAYNQSVHPQWRAKALETLSRISGLEGETPSAFIPLSEQGDEGKPRGLSPEKADELRKKILFGEVAPKKES